MRTAAPTPDPLADADLLYLLGLSFQQLLHAYLARLDAAGWDDLRPVHGFVLRAIAADGMTSVELAARLGVTKQAAGQLVDYLEAHDYVERGAHPLGGRRRLIVLAPRGRRHLDQAGAIMREIEAEWTARAGAAPLAAARATLAALVRAASPNDALPPLRPVW